MTHSKIKETLTGVHHHIQKAICNISKDDNKISWSKEELLLNKLEHRLGKSKEEINKLISKNLLNLLSMVPFNVQREKQQQNVRERMDGSERKILTTEHS